MHQFLEQCLQYVQTHPYMGLLLAFFVAFAESLPIIGTIVPGSITMTAIGALVGAGVMNPYETILCASIGAFSGDLIGYALGNYYDDRIRHIWPFRKHPKWLSASEAFFEKHGRKSIVIGRFVGAARSAVPLVAGLLKMGWLRFCSAAFPTAIAWAIVYMIPGILLGALSLELPPGEVTEFLAIGLGVIVGLWFVFWAIQRFFQQLFNFFSQRVDHLWHWLNNHHSSHWLIQWISDREYPNNHHQLTRLLLCISYFLIFLVIYCSVVCHTSLLAINSPVFYLLQSIRNPLLDHFFVAITLLGQPITLTLATVLISALLFWQKQRRAAYYFFIGMLIASAATYFFKNIAFSPRPEGFYFVKSTSSCPSGHTTLSLVFYSLLAYFTTQVINKRSRWICYSISSALILLIAFSRLYLGAHWLTDIFASAFLGSSLLLFTLLGYCRRPAGDTLRHYPLCRWLTTVLLTVLLSWLIFYYKDHHKLYQHTQPAHPTQYVRLQDWWQQPLHYLPTYRNNRFGKPIQPFNLQWTGKLSKLQQLLVHMGWHITTQHITSKSLAQNQPLWPLLYQHQKAVLFMTKDTDESNKILELRLWKTQIQFTDSKKALWVGIVNTHTTSNKLMDLHHYQKLRYPSNILQKLMQSPQVSYKVIQIDQRKLPSNIQPSQWGGKIFVLRSDSLH